MPCVASVGASPDSSASSAASPLRRRGGLRGDAIGHDETGEASWRQGLAEEAVAGKSRQIGGDGENSLVHQLYVQIKPSGSGVGGEARDGEEVALQTERDRMVRRRGWAPAQAGGEQGQGRLKDQAAIVESVLTGEGGGGGELPM